jgi:hypothetical protein
MRQISSARAISNTFVALTLIVFVGLACGLRKPWRSYERKKFDAQKWRDGEALERGTMCFDLFRHPDLTGQNQDGVVALLGKPDKKVTTEGREVWLYHVELVGEWKYPYFPVSFEKDGRAFGGRIKNGTMSMVVDSDDL